MVTSLLGPHPGADRSRSSFNVTLTAESTERTGLELFDSCDKSGLSLSVSPAALFLIKRWRLHSRRLKETVSLALDSSDEPRPAPIVVKLGPQIAHVPIDQIAPCHVIDAPQAIQDLFASHETACVGRQQI